jgi:hypothetical protein
MLQYGRVIVNDEFGKMWKEVVIAYFKASFQNFPGGTEENHKHFRIGSLWAGNHAQDVPSMKQDCKLLNHNVQPYAM